MKEYQFPNNEHGVQSAFFNWVRKNRKLSPNEMIRDALKLCYAIPNGLSSKESQKAKMEGLTAGIPDVALSWPVVIKSPFSAIYEHQDNRFYIKGEGDGFLEFIPGLFIEMKYGKNTTSPIQKEKIALFRKAGYRCEVRKSTKAAIETVIDYLPFLREDYLEPEYLVE
jgi:hypothetical protein